jgi:N-acetyl-gamma-glutamyl-phosphate reductase
VNPNLFSGARDSFASIDVALETPADVWFSCMPSGALASLTDRIDAPLIIDLSDDHRSAPGWVYGLTEHVRETVSGSSRVANPGCYPTASLLGLVPFVRAGAIDGPVVIDAMSGVSGAGKGLGDSMSFSALHGGVGAYGPTEHRHVREIEQGLEAFGGRQLTVSFTPHLVPMARGLLVTARAPLGSVIDDEDALGILEEAYGSETFVTVTREWPTTKAVAGTNHALVSARVDQRTGLVVVSAAIDNLGKGAAGQALQNANVALGLDESSGLEQLAVWP